MQNFSGTYNFETDRKRVFAALTDPKTIESTIDGCQEIKEVAPNTYEVMVAVNTMGLHTTQPVQIHLTDLEPPKSYVLNLKAKSQVGTIQSKVAVRLEPKDQGSVLHYDAEAKLSGIAAMMGSRMIEVTVKRLLDNFFGKLDRNL